MARRGAGTHRLTWSLAAVLFAVGGASARAQEEPDLAGVLEGGAVRAEDIRAEEMRAEDVLPIEAAAEGPFFFEYTLTQQVTNGIGAYDGWSDRTTATGHYEIEEGVIWARYRWRYHSPDDDRSGDEDRRVPFSSETRTYTSAAVDLDDYDTRTSPPRGRRIWWYLPPDSAAGATVQILDDDFVVVGRVPPSTTSHGRETILAERVNGTGTRDDAYGRYVTHITDRYWFDAETGYFLREVYEEHDVGALEGARAEFDVLETTEVTAASYLPGTTARWSDIAALDGASGGGATGRSNYYDTYAEEDEARARASARHRRWIEFALGALLVLVLGYAFLRWRKSRAKHDFEGKIVRVERAEDLPADPGGTSEIFAPLVPHLVRQTLHANLPVYVARTSTPGMGGVALGAPPGEAATIFARDTAACEALRQAIDSAHFFSEVRHDHAFAARAAASKHIVALEGTHAYNVLETHEVLVLKPVPSETSYDRTLVRRAKGADLPAVIAMLDAVYGGPCKAWIEAAHATGDVILVASEGNAIVGCAAVSVVGTVARFHGLSVAKSHRGKGIGKELNRARVRIASDLGAEQAVVEVAAWNVASLEIARALGFAKAGAMYVETTAQTKTDRQFRRP
jgi:L-amino acid N-acyltransferase YncA